MRKKHNTNKIKSKKKEKKKDYKETEKRIIPKRLLTWQSKARILDRRNYVFKLNKRSISVMLNGKTLAYVYTVGKDKIGGISTYHYDARKQVNPFLTGALIKSVRYKVGPAIYKTDIKGRPKEATLYIIGRGLNRGYVDR